MNKSIKAMIRRSVPPRRLRQIQRYVSPNADITVAWEFKRRFFWSAFKALDFNRIDGDYVEFGSHGGMTFTLAYDQICRRNIERHMWAFDSFQGFPAPSSVMDSHPHWSQGAMATGIADFHEICHSHGIPRKMYTAVEGFYSETLGQMPTDAPPTNIALAYIDCDMYSSTKTVLEFLAPRLKHGMILAFDDYFCWSTDQISGERRALKDVVSRDKKWNLVRYREYGWAGTSFVVENADLWK